MSSAVRWVWANLVGLVVEDSQLALGIVLALVATAAISALGEAVHPFLGWILLALIVVLLFANLVVTARRAKRRVA